jgi:ENTH domain
MDDINRKFKSIDWARLQRQARKVQASTASALKDLFMTDLENKVRAATADTTWGASSSDLMDIAQGTFHREDYALIMSIVWQRLGSTRWRCVYKSLEVLRYLIMHGSARCLEEARAAQHHIQTLEHYRCIDPDTHKDEGENVRARASVVVAMIASSAVLEEEREKDRALRAKLSSGTGVHGPNSHAGGFSSDDYNFGRRTGSGDDPRGTTSGSTVGYGGAYDYSGGYEGAGVSARYDVEARGSLSSRSDSGGYDDAPKGKFSALAKRSSGASSANSGPRTDDNKDAKTSSALMNQSVDDLLGDGPQQVVVKSNTAAATCADDDDDFDPRGFGSSGAVKPRVSASGDDGASDMLATLDLEANRNAGSSMHSGPSGGSLPMSALVQKLAREASAPGSSEKHLQAGAAGTELKGVSAPGFDSGPRKSDSFFDYGVHNPPPDAETSHAANGNAADASKLATAQKPAGSHIVHKEADPFADLVSAVKNAGP